MVEVYNDCVRCPQGCIHCGRESGYVVCSCDKCEISHFDATLYHYGTKMYCEDCLREAAIKEGEYYETDNEEVDEKNWKNFLSLCSSVSPED